MPTTPQSYDSQNRALTSGKLLARNTLLNLVGLVVPTAVALLAIPRIVRGLGTDRFGVLTLIWMVIGYYSLFDLGLSRALTKLVAEKLGRGQEDEVPRLFWTALAMMFGLGIIGALLVTLLAPWMVGRVLKIPQVLQVEMLHSVYILALCLPLVISTAGLRGTLEARQRFELSSIAWALLGISNFLGPLLVLEFSRSLTVVVAVLAICRLLAWVAHLLLCLFAFPALRQFRLGADVVRPLFTFGGWITISNLLSPLLGSLDRFLIGAMLSVAAVAYYATPYELVIRLLIIPGALVGVFFPAFSASFARDQQRTAILFGRVTKIVPLIMFPFVLTVAAFAHAGLNLWLGPEFALKSTRVLQLLVAGIFFNSLGLVAFSLVQGVGRPDLTAKLHLTELAIYVPLVWWLIRTYGIEGAALACLTRNAFDTVVLFVMARRTLRGTASLINRMGLFVGFALTAIAFSSFPRGAAAQIAVFGLVLAAFALFAWGFVLSREERSLVRKHLLRIEAQGPTYTKAPISQVP